MRLFPAVLLTFAVLGITSCSTLRPAGSIDESIAAAAAVDLKNFDIEGHRGARGLAPENTLAAFGKAISLGVTTLELDIGVTADDQVVISHDASLNPAITRDAGGRWLSSRGPSIRSLTAAQLHTYDVGRLNPVASYARSLPEQSAVDGQRIELLATLFKRVESIGANTTRFNIETKLESEPGLTASPEVFVRELLKVIDAASLASPSLRSRITIQSFDWRSLAIIQKVAPDIATSYLTPGNSIDENDSAPERIKAAGGTIWSPGFRKLQARHVSEAHRLGLKVLPWTANEVSDMRHLIDMGVDGIITDYPDRLVKLLK